MSAGTAAVPLDGVDASAAVVGDGAGVSVREKPRQAAWDARMGIRVSSAAAAALAVKFLRRWLPLCE